MPLLGELKAKDIDLIKAWIDAGAPGGAVPEPQAPEPEPGPGGQVKLESNLATRDLPLVASP